MDSPETVNIINRKSSKGTREQLTKRRGSLRVRENGHTHTRAHTHDLSRQKEVVGGNMG